MLKGPDLLGCSFRLAHQKLDQITFSPQIVRKSPQEVRETAPARAQLGPVLKSAEWSPVQSRPHFRGQRAG